MEIELCLYGSLLFERLQNVCPLDEYILIVCIWHYFALLKLRLAPKTHVGL